MAWHARGSQRRTGRSWLSPTGDGGWWLLFSAHRVILPALEFISNWEQALQGFERLVNRMCETSSSLGLIWLLKS